MNLNLKIVNNLTRKKEDFRPQVEGEVKFYSCGPTTYDFLHVGNARALVVGDLFNRILRALGYKVTFVRNYTDIDDKIIAKALEQNRDAKEHAELFVKECERDMESLGMIKPDFTPKVTETMDEIIQMIDSLLQKGVAYMVDGEILYHVPLFAEYGKLSKKDLKSLQHGIRVQVEDHKKHPADFVLWKPAKEGEPYWESPWGKGRPGWHIECSAMALKFLGETIDLHHGGVDLIFPHHENEIAQSEVSNGKPFCLHWCHNEFLNFASEKMSKSLGNVITIRKFVEIYGGIVLRQILMSCHYRARLEWSEEVIEKAMNDVERIHQFVIEVDQVRKKYLSHEAVLSNDEIGDLKITIDRMKEDLANDFNVPGALAHFFMLIRKVRREYLGNENLQKKGFPANLDKVLFEILQFIKKTLGCIHENPSQVIAGLQETRRQCKQDSNAPMEVDAETIEKLILDRKYAKEGKNWDLADEIRKKLKVMNVVLQDHPDGSTTWKFE